MPIQLTILRRTASAALLVIPLCFVASTARAQDTTRSTSQVASYNVLIENVAAGSAISAANLPGEPTTVEQHADPKVPTSQTMAGKPSIVILTTSDTTLLAAARTWMSANNSGRKDTVRPKTVEIDRMAQTGGPFRYILHDAWPTHIDQGTPTSAITLVYQRAEVLH